MAEQDSETPPPLTEEDVQASVSMWIDGLRQGDAASAEELWHRYFERLAGVAERDLPKPVRRTYDGEDVAVSAFHSLCHGVRNGRFPDLRSRDDLWPLLIVIAGRKAGKRRRAENTIKRGGAQAVDVDLVGPIVGSEPTPEFAALVADETDHLLGLLDGDELRAIALGRLEGRSNEELATDLGCAVRTVERRLALIRRTWRERGSASS